MKLTAVFTLLAALALPTAALAQSATPPEPYGIALEGYSYPYPVHLLPIVWEGRSLRMAYMDVASPTPNGRTVLLMHGRNFPGSYWAPTIAALSKAGYRVVVPDQIHFGKSSKPDELPVNFDVMAAHTAALLDHLKIAQVDIVAHSMGGMAGTRFTRTYPDKVRKLVLSAPVGLEDYRQYVPLIPRERLIDQEMALTAEGYFKQLMGIYNPQLTREQFYPFIEVRARMMNSAEYPRWVRSYVSSFYAMWGQPVVHEFPLVRQPTLIMVGSRDRTATGRAFAPPDLREKMGNFPKMAREVAARMPNARADVFEGNGHMLHMEAPERFNSTLIGFLNQP
ncbi:alpha/beta fold hydrolase [Lacisediminimonas profundi]|uniref:alpha/beta fold hydrolase n=1 Tax=Lacisediminimonas profundi TaxID=2603856 RepID=UPI00124B87B4|nr:alpha/beta hydrolase [Lacisediminimonas profundi]